MNAAGSDAGRCLIIAEAGVNHGGSVDAALALVDAAATTGADAVKFQSYRTELLVSEGAPQAEYQWRNAPADSQAAMLRALELSPEAHRAVAERCTERGIEFLSTAFDAPSLELLLELDVKRLKVASGELTNAPMLLRMARTGLPMLVSTGMATLEEVADALAVIAFGRSEPAGTPHRALRAEWRDAVLANAARLDDVTVLHCTSSYPAPIDSVNLAAMDTLHATFALPVGYSDHTSGTLVALAAVARGAVVIEKHLTSDRSGPGPDHAASAEPNEFRTMVDAIRTVELALGSEVKSMTPAERDVRTVARRSLFAARDVPAGRIVSEEDIIALRPGDGVGPAELWDWVGRPSPRRFSAGERLSD
jgi:N-acetylneuraminate synthase